MKLKGNQEAFDAMVVHMRAQKYVRSYVEDADGVSASCVYRGPNGIKCVVGALIRDEHYFEELEGLMPYDPRIKQALRDSGWDAGENLLSGMQSAHDAPILWGAPTLDADGTRFEEAARKAASDYSLTYTPPA